MKVEKVEITGEGLRVTFFWPNEESDHLGIMHPSYFMTNGGLMALLHDTETSLEEEIKKNEAKSNG